MKLSFVPQENSEGFWSASLPKQTEKLLGRFFVVAIAQAAKKHMKRKSMSKPGKFHHHHHHPVIFSHQWSCFTAVMSERLVFLRPHRDQEWLTFLTIFLKLDNWGCLKMRKQFQAGLLLFQHLSWEVLGLGPITKSRKV